MPGVPLPPSFGGLEEVEVAWLEPKADDAIGLSGFGLLEDIVAAPSRNVGS